MQDIKLHSRSHESIDPESVIAIDRYAFNQGENAKYDFSIIGGGIAQTIVARGPNAVCYRMVTESSGACARETTKASEMNTSKKGRLSYWNGDQTAGSLPARNAGGAQRMPDKEHFNCVIKEDELEREYIVRRLTPTECARLQGFPDEWGVPDHKDDFTDEEYHFWLEVRNTHAAINGRQTKEYTKEQVLKWYNKLHTDSAEYKMWGNGLALPTALYVMEGIAEELGKCI